MGSIYEECSCCLRRVRFTTEKERLRAVLLAAGEFICSKCRAGMKEDA